MTRSVRGCLSLRAGVGTEAPAQGWDEGSPEPYTRQGLPPRPPDVCGPLRPRGSLDSILSGQEHLLTRNRPDETDQLPRHRDHRLARRLVPAQEPAQALVQPLLGLPGDPPYARRDQVVTPLDRLAHPRLAAVMPGRLDHDPPDVAVARAGDPPLATAAAAGVLRRDQPHERHQLAGTREPPEVADLGDQGHGADHVNTPQRLERLDQRRFLPGLHRLAHPECEPTDPGAGQLDHLAVVGQDVAIGVLLKVLLDDPGHVSGAPGRLARVDPAVSEQELGEMMTCDSFGDLGIVASPLQVA